VAEINLDFPHEVRLEKGMVLWQEKTLVSQKEYNYFVQGYNRFRSPSPESNRVKIFWDDPPPAPGKVDLRKEDRALEIVWDSIPLSSESRERRDFQGFNIYRRTAGEPFPFSPLNADPIPGNQYWDGQADLGKQYSYAVRAVRNFRGTLIEGPSSAIVQGIPEKRIPPAIPTGLVAVWQKEGVVLRWDKNPEPDVAGYNLYRREKEGKEFVLLNPGLIAEPYYLDGSADSQRSYIYRLQAVDASPTRNESDFSKEVEVSPEAPGKN
jgi:fibronectin type 3 domain-containing protein